MTRWLPRSEDELRSALDHRVITEGHFFDVKRQLDAGTSASKHLAIDVASFAVDGGVIAVGVDEDKELRTFELSPVALAGLAERVDQVTRSRVDPPLQVACIEVPASERPGHGYLLISVPASPLAPHMVDGRYRGRRDTSNTVLPDTDVRRLHDRAALTRDRGRQLLQAELDRDPSPPSENPQARLFVVAQPVAADSGLLYRNSGAHGLAAWVTARVRDGPPGYRSGTLFTPDIGSTQPQRRADGFALATYQLGPGRVPRPNGDLPVEDIDLLELEVREDGGLRLFCGGASNMHESDERIVFEPLIAGLTYRMLLTAGEVMTTTRYGGSWDLAVAVTNLRFSYSSLLHNPRRSRFTDLPYYSAEGYSQAVRVEGDVVMDRPIEVLESLCGRLHRGLSGAQSVHTLVAPLVS